MFAIQNTLVSLDLLERYFVCDLQACKGICCVKGDAGAPLTDEEINILEDIVDDVLPFLDKEGTETIATKGVFEIDVDGDKGTALLPNDRCAYARVTEDGLVSCAIEEAYAKGKVSFKKHPQSLQHYTLEVSGRVLDPPWLPELSLDLFFGALWATFGAMLDSIFRTKCYQKSL